MRSNANLLAALALFGAAAATEGTVINTTNPADIAAFQSGATVQTFDSISGITAVPITSYSPLDITGTGALFTKDPAQSPYYNSGGASFNDPASNPGTPIGIVAPSGAIAGDKFSGNNVAGPLGVVTPPFTVFESGAFMEVIFPTAVSKVGLFVSHGNVTLILKDTSNSNLATGDVQGSASAGQFLGISRASADIGGVTLLGNGPFTIDDFTFGLTGSGGGGGTGGGGGGNTVPDTGHVLNLALAAAFLGLARWKLKSA
ncbi:MAG: hypothetical protein AB9869_32705 [Verrucomicrobiia bacterium]